MYIYNYYLLYIDKDNTFWSLWQKYQDYLYKCCLKWMGNSMDAEDALSQAMLKAWKKINDSRHEIKNFKGWLTQLTYNLCVDIHRERHRGARQVEPDFQPSINAFSVEVVEGSYTPVMIALQPSYTVAGIVSDTEGKPVAGAKVEAINPDTNSSVISIANTAGVFYLEQLRLGTYQLKVNGKSVQPNIITIKADSNTLQELNLNLP